MPGPNHYRVVDNTELLSKGVIEAMTYTFKFSNIPMTDGSGGWNIDFLLKTFEGTRNRDVLVDFVRTRFMPVASSQPHGSIYGIEVRDLLTGNHMFGFSGTEVLGGWTPMVETIGSDIQLVVGATWLPNSPYQATYQGMNTWLGQRLALIQPGRGVEIVGQSLGGYVARDMAQANGIPMSNVTLFQAPGEFGLFGQIVGLATFGIFNDGNINYVRSPDIIPSAGLGSRYVFLGSEREINGVTGALIGGHGMNRINDDLVDLARASRLLTNQLPLAGQSASAWLSQSPTFSINGVAVAVVNNLEGSYLVSLEGGNLAGFATISRSDFMRGRFDTPMARASRDQAANMGTPVLPSSNIGAQLGAALGSSVGVMLGGSNPLAQIGAGTILGALGSAFGQWLDHDLAGVQMRIGDGLAQSFGQQLQASFQSTGISVISSQLTNIAMQAIGITGFGGQLAGVVVNTAVTHGVRLALSRLPGSPIGAPTNFAGAVQGNIAAFFGAKLGSLLVSPTTQAGSILGSLGSTLGQIAARQIFASMGWMAGPIGAFIGTVLGTLIGNLFGRKKPKVPTANAEVYLNYTSDRFEAGPSSAANGGNLNLVRSMAASAEATLNGFVATLAGNAPFETTSWSSGLWRNGKLVSTTGGLQTFYGHTGGQLWVRLGSQTATQQNVESADDAVSRGVIWSLSGMQIIGGDIFAKRAVENSSKENLAVLLADLQVAEDYRKYRQDYLEINQVIAQNPNSALTAGWIQAFQRAGELKLNDWSKSDFYGGLQGFLMSFGTSSGIVDFEGVTVSFAGGLRIQLAPDAQEGALSVLHQADADGRGVTITDPTKVGYTHLTSGNSAGNDFLDFSLSSVGVQWSDLSTETTWETYYDDWGGQWQEEVTVSVSGGNDIVVGGSAGDSLSGQAGWDWLDGRNGADTLYGGAGNDVLLGGLDDDELYGGADDDYLAGGDGDDILNGDDGADILIGGAGSNALYGGAGDDVLIVDRDDAYIDYLVGGSGSDTLSYERRGAGITLTMGVAAGIGSYFSALGNLYLDIENITGTRFNDTIVGDASANVLKGGAGDDVLNGGGGDDVLEGGFGADQILGGGGADTASYESSNAAVFVDFTTGEAFGGHASGDRFTNLQHLRGSRFADELKGDASDNRIEGLGGDDWIEATKGGDIYDGGDGVDTVDYSQNFSSGTSSEQVWVEEGYWYYNPWDNTPEWIETGPGYWETQTAFRQGLVVNGGLAYWRSDDGSIGTHSLVGIEQIIGTAGADSISMGAGDDHIAGGKGNDSLAGGAGSDTYYLDLGDGADTVTETNVGSNVVSFGDGIGFNQLTFTVVAGPSGHMTINYSATDSIRINGNLPNVKDGKLASADDNRLKIIDMNGAGQLDVSQFEIYRGGTAGADTLSGIRTLGDFLVGFGGNDIIYGMQPGQWEDHGNIIIGGAGNDTSYTSTGDDQFAFERGSGRDTVYDSGGEDTLVLGPNVAASDVIYKVIGNDLYIGIAEAANPNLEAHQVTDYVRVVDGGVKWHDVYGGGDSFSTIEFVNVGGTWIDLRKLDINWTVQNTYNGGVLPIVFDLEGDGLDLTSVDASMVVSRLSSGEMARTSWVGPRDGILAVDRNGDGQINNLSEISFVQDKEGATTDLEGLRGWDSNGDGKLNALDEGWGRLKIWVDRNQNGRSTNGELRTLEEAGITEINLTGQATGNTAANSRDSVVHNTLSFTWASGQVGTAYDVQLARRLLSEHGLSVEQVRAIWGADRSVEGELGRLLENPVVAAAARTILLADRQLGAGARTQRDPLPTLAGEGGGGGQMDGDAVDLTEIPSEPTQPLVDFSDHDDLYAADEARWLDLLFGEAGDGLTDPGVRASLEAFQGRSIRGAYGRASGRPLIEADQVEPESLSAPDSIVGDGPGALRTTASGSYPMSSAGASTGYAGGEDPVLAAAALVSAGGLDPYAPVDFILAAVSGQQAWWLGGEQSRGIAVDGLLPSLVDPVVGAVSTGVGADELSQHQRLTQALASFGRDPGASAAVWKRSGEIQDHDTGLQMAGARHSRFTAHAAIPA